MAASADLVCKENTAILVPAQAARETWSMTGHVLVSCMAAFAIL